jgi:hypothetical protein
VQSVETPTLDSNELTALYDTRKSDADRRFRSKLVQVRGLVERLGKNFVSLKNPGAKHSIRCIYSGGQNAPEGLARGMSVFVRGTVSGKRWTGRIELQKCEIIHTGSQEP